MNLKHLIVLLVGMASTGTVLAGKYFETRCLPAGEAHRQLAEKKDHAIRKYGDIIIYHQSCFPCSTSRYRGRYCKMVYENGR